MSGAWGEGEEGALEVMGERLWGAGLPWGGGARACLVRRSAGMCCFLYIQIRHVWRAFASRRTLFYWATSVLLASIFSFMADLCLSCAKYDCCSSCPRKRQPGGTDGGGEAGKAGTTKNDDDENDTIAWRRRVPNTQNETEEPSTHTAPFSTRPRTHNI